MGATVLDKPAPARRKTEPRDVPQTDLGPRLWTRDEYYRAAELGIFRPGERLELIEGEIIAKVSPVGSPHRFTVYQTAHALEDAFGSGFYVDDQAPLTISNNNEPEPDIWVAVGPALDYQHRHPEPSDIRLVVEVSDSTVAYDRGKKRRIYSNSGIPEYWIINLSRRCVEVYRDPNPKTGYGAATILAETETVTPLFAPEAAIPISGLLPDKVKGR